MSVAALRLEFRALFVGFFGLAMLPLFADDAEANTFAPGWAKARAEWNAIGDRAEAGDKAALKKLRDTVNRCRITPACSKPHPLSEARTPDQMAAAVAATNLASMYLRGSGLKKDLNRAFYNYNVAAVLGYPIALTKVGDFYRHGWGPGGVSRTRAMMAYLYAQRGGDVEAAIMRARMLKSAGNLEEAIKGYIVAESLDPTPMEQARIKKEITPLLNGRGYSNGRERTHPRQAMLDAGQKCIKETEALIERRRSGVNSQHRRATSQCASDGSPEACRKRANSDFMYSFYSIRSKAMDRARGYFPDHCRFEVRRSEYDILCAENRDKKAWCSGVTFH